MQPPATLSPDQAEILPDHTQLPDRDGSIVNNYQEHPQSSLLSDCLRPRLHEVYPDGQFSIGCDSGIYYQYTQPPLAGCKAPDWFLVPGVPPLLDGVIRRSYVLWKEMVKPLLVIEYVSGDGSEERDRTPRTGKFWVYEQAISASYYAIFEVSKAAVEVYRLEGGRYRPVAANALGRYPIEPLGIELGIWEGKYQEMEVPWLRVWDSASGKILPTSEEQAEAEKQRADAAEELLDDTRQLLNEEVKRAEKLAEKLRELGIEPEA
jgi:Uma2 family endonuclease